MSLYKYPFHPLKFGVCVSHVWFCFCNAPAACVNGGAFRQDGRKCTQIRSALVLVNYMGGLHADLQLCAFAEYCREILGENDLIDDQH